MARMISNDEDEYDDDDEDNDGDNYSSENGEDWT